LLTYFVVAVGGEGSVDVLEMALRMASEPQDSGTCSRYVNNECAKTLLAFISLQSDVTFMLTRPAELQFWLHKN